jgi:hypothetical protein
MMSPEKGPARNGARPDDRSAVRVCALSSAGHLIDCGPAQDAAVTAAIQWRGRLAKVKQLSGFRQESAILQFEHDRFAGVASLHAAGGA